MNLERVFDEIDALNSTDNCLATRIQILEKALKANHGIVKQHTVEINELKNASSVPMEPIKTDGPIDTSAIFQQINQLAAQLKSHKEITNSEFKDLHEKTDQMVIDYKAYTDKQVADLEDRLNNKFDKAL